MDIQKLIEAAKQEGGAQAFADMVQAQLQADVVTATAKITAEKEAAQASVKALEAKSKEFGDEMKPLQAFLKEKGMAWKSEADLEALGQALEGKGEPTEDVMKLARRLAGPMAEEGMTPLRNQVTALEEQLTQRGAAVEAAVAATDRTHGKLLLKQAQGGQDSPQLIESFEDYFLDTFFLPFLHFEEVSGPDGKTRRVPATRNGDVPIMTAEGQAGPADLLKMAYEQSGVYADSGAQPGQPNTRDFFVSSGTGAGSRRNEPHGHQPAVDAKALGQTQSLAEYREQRKKVAS